MDRNERGMIVPLILFGMTALLSGIGLLFYFLYYPKTSAQKPTTVTPTIRPIATDAPEEIITDFKSCVNAGNPVAESYPRTCRADGKVFTEIVEASSSAVEASPSGDRVICKVGGCNGDICASVNSNNSFICVDSPEASCYKDALCEVQSDGRCGWTQTPELVQCIQDKRVQ